MTATRWPPEFDRILRAHCHLADPGEPIDPEEPLALLGVDSVRTLSMIVQVEETYRLAVPDELLAGDGFATAGAFWRTVSALRGADG